MSTSKAKQEHMSPSEALERLMEGNKRFVSGKGRSYDYSREVGETASGQYPFAAILGCIDSRAAAEQVFDQGIGDIFNTRVAGNIVNDDVLASLEFACKVIGAKLILVMGHTACGAVNAACDRVELGHITGLLSRITPVVDAAGPNPVVDDVAEQNVRHSVERIRAESNILASMESDGSIMIRGAMYDVANGRVSFLEF